MAGRVHGAQVTIYVNLSTQTRFCIGISQVFVSCTLLPDIWHRLKSLPQITGSEQARNRDVFKTLVTSITFTYMELPPSYEEAIQQPVEPFDNSSVGNFYRQVLLLQLSCFDIVDVMQQISK